MIVRGLAKKMKVKEIVKAKPKEPFMEQMKIPARKQEFLDAVDTIQDGLYCLETENEQLSNFYSQEELDSFKNLFDVLLTHIQNMELVIDDCLILLPEDNFAVVEAW